VDALVARKQRQLGPGKSPVCDDATFIRRIGFDLIGTSRLAGDREIRSGPNPDKRAKLVDALLARPEYADYLDA